METLTLKNELPKKMVEYKARLKKEDKEIFNIWIKNGLWKGDLESIRKIKTIFEIEKSSQISDVKKEIESHKKMSKKDYKEMSDEWVSWSYSNNETNFTDYNQKNRAHIRSIKNLDFFILLEGIHEDKQIYFFEDDEDLISKGWDLIKQLVHCYSELNIGISQ